MRMGAKIIEIMSWIFGSLLGIRFIMKFFGASTVAPFVVWLYGVTDSLMAPFRGIFPTPKLGTEGLIDIPAIVALVVYIVAGYFLAAFIEAADNNLRFKSLRTTPKPTKDVSTPPQHNYAQPPATSPNPIPPTAPQNPIQNQPGDLN